MEIVDEEDEKFLNLTTLVHFIMDTSGRSDLTTQKETTTVLEAVEVGTVDAAVEDLTKADATETSTVDVE